MNVEQPAVPHRPKRLKTQAPTLLPRSLCHLAERLLHTTLFPLPRIQPHKHILLHGSPFLPAASTAACFSRSPRRPLRPTAERNTPLTACRAIHKMCPTEQSCRPTGVTLATQVGDRSAR